MVLTVTYDDQDGADLRLELSTLSKYETGEILEILNKKINNRKIKKGCVLKVGTHHLSGDRIIRVVVLNAPGLDGGTVNGQEYFAWAAKDEVALFTDARCEIPVPCPESEDDAVGGRVRLAADPTLSLIHI